MRSVPEEKHANQDERVGNCIPDKVHPMDALTATKAGVFVIDIKTIPAPFHLTNQPRQNQTIALRRMMRRTLCLNARTPPKNFSSDFESESPQSMRNEIKRKVQTRSAT